MAWNDLLGFLFVLFIFLVLLFSKQFTSTKQKNETLPRLGESEPEEESTPFPTPPPPVPWEGGDDYALYSKLEPKKKKKKGQTPQVDPVTRALKGKTPLQKMMLATEIFGKTKGLP